MSIGHKKPSYYLTYYDRLHFLVKIFHMEPDILFEKNVKNTFRSTFIRRDRDVYKYYIGGKK
jgi:hypothetical protein